MWSDDENYGMFTTSIIFVIFIKWNTIGAFSKFRFEFPEISNDEWHFPEVFRKENQV